MSLYMTVAIVDILAIGWIAYKHPRAWRSILASMTGVILAAALWWLLAWLV
jgi:hypothetical protein